MSEQTAPAGAVVDRDPGPTEEFSLLEDEVVLATVHPSWAYWLKPMGLAGVLAFAAIVAMAVGDLGAAVGELVAAGFFLAYVRLARSHSRYIVTNQRVKKTVGLLSTTTAETTISEIKALVTHQGLVDRFLDTGSVNIDSAGADGFIGIRGVPEHEALAELIRDQQQAAAPASASTGYARAR